jgi:hypothetical protein
MRKTAMPKYKIPSDEEALSAIYAAVSNAGEIESQHCFKELVQRELVRLNPQYRLGAKKLRLLSFRSGYVKIQIHTREDGRRDSKNLKSCPVCGGRLKKQKNKTIYGGKITLGFNCPKCSYTTGIKYRRPVRYIFSKHHQFDQGNRTTKIDNGLLFGVQ